MYFDYVGMKDNRIYGILNISCDDRGLNKDDHNINVIKFWGTNEKISVKTETVDYWKITDIVDFKERTGYVGLTHNMISDFDFLSNTVKTKLSKRYMWEKLKE